MKNNKIIDLFSGAGGLSLGFEYAGFKSELAVDFWAPSIETYNKNRKDKVGKVLDISKLDQKYFNNNKITRPIGVIGGPPCQGFSLAGKRIIDDERNKLYREYFRVLNILKPDFFLIENVVGLTNLNGGAVKLDIIKRSDSIGYKIYNEILCASEHGVPQNRKRVFFVGIKKDIYKKCGEFNFPKKQKKKITCYEAISDLPNLDNNDNNKEYKTTPTSKYQEAMRKNSTIVHNHEQSRHTTDTIKAISCVPEGGGMNNIPIEIRKTRKYSSLLRRMDSKQPSQTIDTGHRTYFHFKENRVISVREAARLQSFPDNYVFYGNKQDQYKQVGNAVPPLLAYEIAKCIKEYLNRRNK